MKKQCTKCKLQKDISLFSKDKSHISGLQSICKDCTHEYYMKNKLKLRTESKTKEVKRTEEQRVKAREYGRKYRERKKGLNKLNSKIVKLIKLI